jgi:hypothetical protein
LVCLIFVLTSAACVKLFLGVPFACVPVNPKLGGASIARESIK